jgi:tetratricopeptide (TPR) repeat protein
MRRVRSILPALFASLAAGTAPAQVGGPMAGRQSGPQPDADLTQPSAPDKPEAAALKAFAAGMKAVGKARDYDAAALKAATPDKKAIALEKSNDALYQALDQFTEALRNKSDMVEAWSEACYVHLRLGAHAESVDDCDHALQLQQDNLPAIEHRAEAYLALNRLADAKAAYMDLFNHARDLADRLMAAMQRWLGEHRQDAAGVRGADLDAFDHWVQERTGIANQSAALAPAAPAATAPAAGAPAAGAPAAGSPAAGAPAAGSPAAGSPAASAP